MVKFYRTAGAAAGIKRIFILFDSTTISLFQEVLRGAGIRSLNGKRKGGIKVHTLLKSDQDVPAMIRFSPSSHTPGFDFS